LIIDIDITPLLTLMTLILRRHYATLLPYITITIDISLAAIIDAIIIILLLLML
jgi:hypothetical protein